MQSICDMWFKCCPMREASRITYKTKNLTRFIFLWKDGFRVEWSYYPPHGLIFDLHCLKKEV